MELAIVNDKLTILLQILVKPAVYVCFPHGIPSFLCEYFDTRMYLFETTRIRVILSTISVKGFLIKDFGS